MQQRLDNLGSTTSERDTALRFLEQQVDQATGEIAGSDKTNELLRGETAVLSDQVEDMSRDRDRLTGEVGERRPPRSSSSPAKWPPCRASWAGRRPPTPADARARDRAPRSDGRSRQGWRGGAAARRDGRPETRDRAPQRAAGSCRDQGRQPEDTITGLDAKLAEALARKIEELEQYRSEFFGRLHQALGDRPDLRVVGDRFVFQSELLFASGSASLGAEGEAELRQLAPITGGGGGTDPARHRLDPAGRRPHRPAADPRRHVPLQLGAVGGPGDLR